MSWNTNAIRPPQLPDGYYLTTSTPGYVDLYCMPPPLVFRQVTGFVAPPKYEQFPRFASPPPVYGPLPRIGPPPGFGSPPRYGKMARIEQPSGFTSPPVYGQLLRFGQPSGFASPPVYGQLLRFGQPSGFASPPAYGQPSGFETPRGYGQIPPVYGQPSGFEVPPFQQEETHMCDCNYPDYHRVFESYKILNDENENLEKFIENYDNNMQVVNDEIERLTQDEDAYARTLDELLSERKIISSESDVLDVLDAHIIKINRNGIKNQLEYLKDQHRHVLTKSKVLKRKLENPKKYIEISMGYYKRELKNLLISKIKGNQYIGASDFVMLKDRKEFDASDFVMLKDHKEFNASEIAYLQIDSNYFYDEIYPAKIKKREHAEAVLCSSNRNSIRMWSRLFRAFYKTGLYEELRDYLVEKEE